MKKRIGERMNSRGRLFHTGIADITFTDPRQDGMNGMRAGDPGALHMSVAVKCFVRDPESLVKSRALVTRSSACAAATPATVTPSEEGCLQCWKPRDHLLFF
jgi:hypothetical protein